MTQLPTPSLLPHDYSRRILLAVEAYSPQTVTETLYALTQNPDGPALIPTELHIITTGLGQQCIESTLRTQLHQLCHDYALPLSCAQPQFYCITDAAQHVLWDIRSATDNEHTANFISHHVQRLTADPAASVIALLSGGRRSMTYYLGYALSLFGRPQDRLKHVRVDDAYYYHAEFYYPPPQTRILQDKQGNAFDASQVTVTLADLPFVRLRDGLPNALLQGKTSFSNTVQAAQQSLGLVQVELTRRPPALRCGGQAVRMTPVDLAFYAWMLQRCQQGKAFVHWSNKAQEDLVSQFLTVYRDLHGRTGSYERVKRCLAEGLSKTWFEERKSQVNRQLKAALGGQQAQAYLLGDAGQRPCISTGVWLKPEQIHA